MKNSTKHIGRRIFETRKSRGMTQNELCGTEITRNHLSLIERGKALPSLSAICYIADRLEVPVGFFFSDDEKEDSKFINFFSLDPIKEAFSSYDFEKCISLAEDIPFEMLGDEIALIYSRACIIMSIRCAERLDMSRAQQLLEKALKASHKCCYSDKDIVSAAEFYKLLFTSVSDSVIPIRLTDLHEASSYVPAELILYLKAVSENGCGETARCLTSNRHKQHLEAIYALKEGRTEAAFGLFHELSEFMSLPYYMKYRVYDGLEICAERLGYYDIAYSAAKKKLELKNI